MQGLPRARRRPHRARSTGAARRAAWWLGLAVLAAACGGDPPASPFGQGGAGGAGGSGTGGEGGGEEGLGGPCVEDAQCDDGVACTLDRCDLEIERCRFAPDAALCSDGVYCNGNEVCDLTQGCAPGPPTSCSDDDPCTIDRCVEATRSCEREPRDADGDGDPDDHCGGGDCDDQDPNVSGEGDEICGNEADDDCDDAVDEDDCVAPEHDTCLDPLVVDASGTHVLSTAGAGDDYATGCEPEAATRRDVVVAVIPPAGDAVDVWVRARTTATAQQVAVAVATQCSDPGSEIACSPSFVRANGGSVARVRARGVGGGTDPEPLVLYVTTSTAAEVTLDVAFEPSSVAATNETCGTAAPLTLGTATSLEIVDAAADLESTCETPTGELLYEVVLDTPSDLDVYASSLDDDGRPAVSLRTAACALAEDELTCHQADPAHVYRKALPAGTYYLAVSASAPTDASVLAVASAPTAVADDEDCSGTATLTAGSTVAVVFDDHQDDHTTPCFAPARDAAYRLVTAAPSDVLLVQRMSSSDTGALALTEAPCGAEDGLVCDFGAGAPNRVRRRALPAGDHRVVVESLVGSPQELTAFVRPAAPTTLVLFADACGDALTIPPAGGILQGNTSSATADFDAGCDQAGGEQFGAPEQLLRLVLDAPKRVVLDATGSTYPVLLDVRKGPSCPGAEVALGCTIATGNGQPFLDLDLEAGAYFVQVDGVGGATGAWVLDVHLADP